VRRSCRDDSGRLPAIVSFPLGIFELRIRTETIMERNY